MLLGLILNGKYDDCGYLIVRDAIVRGLKLGGASLRVLEVVAVI
jgi:hypothetical protein